MVARASSTWPSRYSAPASARVRRSAATGSACSAGVAQPSHVLLAMGLDAELSRSSLRFSLGHTSSDADVAAAVAAIGPAVERARNARVSVEASRHR